MKPIIVVLTCEHAVNTVPKRYRPLFQNAQELLTTHRGIDFGALSIAQQVQRSLSCDLIQAQATRLLIDCNRSTVHAHCFSEITKSLSIHEKNTIITEYYQPFRQQSTNLIQQYIQQGRRVWHLSIHSFTPQLNGVVRTAEIGFLYDPKRSFERQLAYQWKREIKQLTSDYRIRMNYPYSGISDGFTQTLRQQFAEQDYVGIEVESNQALTLNMNSLELLKNILAKSLSTILLNS